MLSASVAIAIVAVVTNGKKQTRMYEKVKTQSKIHKYDENSEKMNF